jgi:hypothetical protein
MGSMIYTLTPEIEMKIRVPVLLCSLPDTRWGPSRLPTSQAKFGLTANSQPDLRTVLIKHKFIEAVIE